MEKQNLLLFSLQLGDWPYQYKLYFAEAETLTEEDPVIHCFCLHSRKRFFSLELGGIYSITANGIFIREMEKTGRQHMSEEDYLYLLDTRDMIFMNDEERMHVGLDRQDYDPHELYYSLKNAEAIYKYEPTWKERLFRICLKAIEYSISTLIPIGLFLIYVFAMTYIKSSSESFLAPYVLPIAAASSMPLMFFLMSFLYRLGEALLLNAPTAKYITLKKYFLLWAGMKKAVAIEALNTELIKKAGITTAILFFVGLVILLFV